MDERLSGTSEEDEEQSGEKKTSSRRPKNETAEERRVRNQPAENAARILPCITEAVNLFSFHLALAEWLYFGKQVNKGQTLNEKQP